MNDRLPLATLLSHVLVAFTIEFDNEFERRMPHRTTNRGATAETPAGPWLGSLVMWCNCMRFVDAAGISARELERRARTATNLKGMERWGYLRIGSDRLIRATPIGLVARDVWRPLFAAIEQRWRARFDLPRLAGVSKESIAIAIGYLERHGYATTNPESPGSRFKVLALTPPGRRAREQYRQLLPAIEQRWRERFGEPVIDGVRAPLEQLVGTDARHASLLAGLEPYPAGWRSAIRRPEGLPHYPMVSHRGGFPDGS